jgi:hypothetical protein
MNEHAIDNDAAEDTMEDSIPTAESDSDADHENDSVNVNDDISGPESALFDLPDTVPLYPDAMHGT